MVRDMNIRTIGYVPGGGMVLIMYRFASECIDNIKYQVEGFASGFSIGLGIKSGITISSGVYYDRRMLADPFQFQGEAKFVMAGAAISALGIGVSALQLGDARIFTVGWEAGIDY